jgi:hypothetical protein
MAHRPGVRAAYEMALAEVAERAKVSRERVLAEYRAIAMADISDIATVTDEGTVKIEDFSTLPRETLAAIKRIRETKHGIDIELHDKRGALADLARHLGLFSDDDQAARQAVGVQLNIGAPPGPAGSPGSATPPRPAVKEGVGVDSTTYPPSDAADEVSSAGGGGSSMKEGGRRGGEWDSTLDILHEGGDTAPEGMGG